MELRCSLVDSDSVGIKNFTATVISENGNTIDRANTTNGRVALSLINDTLGSGFRGAYTSVTVYTLECVIKIDEQTTITKREKVAVTARDLTVGHINIVSIIGDMR